MRASDELRASLRHVRWLGGAPGAGKSTIARRLASSYGLQIFTVEPFSKYGSRLTESEAPLFYSFASMDMDERWLRRSPAEMFETFHGFQEEGFDLIIEDIQALPANPPILAEGFKLLPRLVAPLLTDGHQAVWLLPTDGFRRVAFAARGSTWEIPSKTTDPARALANLYARDDLFTESLRQEVNQLGLSAIEMDTAHDLESSASLVATALALS